MIIFLIIIFLIFISLLGYVRLRKDASNIPDDNIICFTGGVGSGKTYIAVHKGVDKYKHLLFKYKLSKIPLIRSIFQLKGFAKPYLYSNIPLNVPYDVQVFKIEHLTGVEILPENCVCIIDEFGQFCSQHDFNNILVKENVQFIVRFFRHFTGGFMYCTDQSFNEIAVCVRRRVNIIYNLQHFERAKSFLIPLPFAKIVYQQLINTDDNMQTQGVRQIENFDYFLIRLPYFKTKNNTLYNTRCYKKIYKEGFIDTLDINKWKYNKGYTNYLADVNISYYSLIKKRNGLKDFKKK